MSSEREREGGREGRKKRELSSFERRKSLLGLRRKAQHKVHIVVKCDLKCTLIL